MVTNIVHGKVCDRDSFGRDVMQEQQLAFEYSTGCGVDDFPVLLLFHPDFAHSGQGYVQV